jgi:hypothetical protein
MTVIIAIAIAATFAGAADAGRARCASAVVSETFVLPDGSEHAGGTLTICDRRYNPVRSLVGTYVDGVAVGWFVSDRRRTEMSDQGKETIVFRRDAAGRLRLAAFAAAGVRGSDLFTLP